LNGKHDAVPQVYKMLKNIFRFSMLLLLSTAALVAITPIFSVNNLLYPIRIDSAFVSQKHYIYEKSLSEGKVVTPESFLYSPSQLKINFIDITLPVADSTILRGWLAIDTTRLQSPLLFIVPDISEGAVTYIPAMKQFCDRGFNVCVMNMRGQGNSDGEVYSPGEKAAADVAYLVKEIRKMPFIDKVILMGSGTGAGIVLKAVTDTAFADVIILQNPLVNLRKYLTSEAVTKWGAIVLPIMPAVIRSYEKTAGLNISQYNYEKLISSISIPPVFIAANFFSGNDVILTRRMYNASEHTSKKLFIDNTSFRRKSNLENDKSYYDKVSALINSSLPVKKKKSRFRRLAAL
jgi:hypothetical protein